MNHKDKDKVQNVTRCDSDVLFSFISQRRSQTETNLFFWVSWKQVEGKNKLAIEFGLGRKTGVKSLPTSLRERSRSWMRNNFDDYVTLSGSVWDSLAVLALIFARLDRLAAPCADAGRQLVCEDYKWLRCPLSPPLPHRSLPQRLRLTCSRG